MSKELLPAKNNELMLQVNGVQYRGFTYASFSRSLENPLGQFNFQTTAKESNDAIVQADIRCQDEVEIYVDDTKILTGFIEEVTIDYSADSHSISFRGRDKTSDLQDSSIIPKSYNIKNFKNLIETVLKDNGYTNIKVYDDVGNLNLINYNADNNGNTSIVNSGDTILSFLDRYAKRLQVLLITDSDGDIRIVREGNKISSGSLNSQVNNPNNNILQANINASTIDRFRTIEVRSQQGNSGRLTKVNLNQQASAFDKVIRSRRRKIVDLDISTQELTLNELAKWNVNLRIAKGARYNCRVQGFYEQRDRGFVWQPNTLVNIIDDKCRVSGQFLVQGVVFEKSKGGTFTNLLIVNKGAFTVNDSLQKSYNAFGDLASNLISSD